MSVTQPIHLDGASSGSPTRLALALALLSPLAGAQYHFSHDDGTIGLAPGAVQAAPDVRDVFETDLPSGDLVTMDTNILKVDNPLIDVLDANDDVDALCDDGSGFFVLQDGVFSPNFVFSVKPGAVAEGGTPVNLQAPFNAADVFNFLGPPQGHGSVNFDDQMDLHAANVSESIDGIHVFADPDDFAPGSRVHFSLAKGSPTLAANGWSAADILTTVVGSGVITVAIDADEIGLSPNDDLDGLVMNSVYDEDGDGDLTDQVDFFQLWFSVDTGAIGRFNSDVRAESVGNGVHGDVYFTAGAQDNKLFYDAIRWTRLLVPDVVDALDIAGDVIQLSGPPPSPLDPPPQVLQPPLRPFCGGWIGICNGTQPKDVGAQLLLELVDDNGAPVTVPFTEKHFKANPNHPDAAWQKALLMAAFLRGITVDVGGQDVPLFDDSSIRIGPPVHFPGVAQVEKEICVSLSPQFSATGWSIRHFGLSMDNWTAGFLSEDYDWQTPLFRMYRLSMDTVPTAPGLLRAAFGDSFGNTQVFQTPFAAGEDPTDVMQRMIDEINNSGGEACFDFPDPLGVFPSKEAIVVARVPLEPPVQGNQFGPYLEEFGANGNDVTVSIKFEARTDRVQCPVPTPIPTLGEWGRILMSLLLVTLGLAFLVRSPQPATGGGGVAVGAAPPQPSWDGRLYRRCLFALAGLAVLGGWITTLATGAMAAVDAAGLAVTVPLAAWTLQLLIGARR